MSKVLKRKHQSNGILLALLGATALAPAMAANDDQTAGKNTKIEVSGQNGLYQSLAPATLSKAPTLIEGVAASLTNGTPLTGLNGASSSETFYTLEVPSDANSLTFNLSGGTGDADLHVRFGSAPTTSSYDCRPYASGNNESCDISNIQAGTYHVMLQAYSAYDGVTLQATYTTGSGPVLPAHRIAVAGDSITKAFGADCTSNYWWWQKLCPAGGDQEQHSWFDGSSTAVFSVYDRYLTLDNSTTVNHSAAASGSEMRGGDNNLVVQANNIINQAEKPNHVEIVLGGNDICNRGCTDGANCADPLYSEGEWRQSVQDGLNVLMSGMPAENSSILLGGVPRVQDILQAGLDLEAQNGQVDCQAMWSSYNVCRIVTNTGTFNGESKDQRHTAIAAMQQRYNEILREEAAAYNSNSNGLNPNGIQVTAEYVNESTPTAGTFSFGSEHLNGGDCFHPNVMTQGLIAEMLWNANPNKPQ